MVQFVMICSSFFSGNKESLSFQVLLVKAAPFLCIILTYFITEEEKDSLQQLPLKINFTPESHNDGLATYFREYLRAYLKKWVKNNPKPNGELYNINRDGLKIYVTIDSRMQKYAQEAVYEHMANLQGYFNREHAKNETAPFYDLEDEQIDMIYKRARRTSDRYRSLNHYIYIRKSRTSTRV